MKLYSSFIRLTGVRFYTSFFSDFSWVSRQLLGFCVLKDVALTDVDTPNQLICSAFINYGILKENKLKYLRKFSEQICRFSVSVTVNQIKNQLKN